MPAQKKVGKGQGTRNPYRNLPPKEPQRISLFDAVALTQRYRRSAPASEHGGFFWSDGVREILEQPGCVGLRYYHGLDAGGGYQIVFVGVDSNGADIVSSSATKGTTASAKGSARSAGGDAVLLDQHWPCPPFCDPKSPLL